MGEDAHAARAMEDTFVLGDTAYVYSEQDWSQCPVVADDAFRETRRAYWKYWGSLIAHLPIHENGHRMTRDEMRARTMELAGGLFALTPFLEEVTPVIRRGVNALLVMHGVHMSLDY